MQLVCNLDIGSSHSVAPEVEADTLMPFISSKRHGGGINLAMARQLIQSNGGTVRHVRPVGIGAHFIITF